MTDNIKINKDQNNDAIYNEPTFDMNSSNLSSGTKDPLPVVAVSLLGGKKHIATTVAGLTCLWYSRSTDRMIKIRYNE